MRGEGSGHLQEAAERFLREDVLSAAEAEGEVGVVAGDRVEARVGGRCAEDPVRPRDDEGEVAVDELRAGGVADDVVAGDAGGARRAARSR